MIADIYPASKLGSVMSKVLIANMFGFLGKTNSSKNNNKSAGPPLGGLLNDYVGPKAPYLFCAGLTFLDLLVRLAIKPQKINSKEVHISEKVDIPPQIHHTTSISTDIVESVNLPPSLIHQESVTFIHLLSDPQVVVTFLTIILAATVFSGIEPTLPLYLFEKFGLSPSQIGLLYIAIIIPNAITGLIVGPLSDKHGRKNFICLGAVFFGVACPLVALSGSIALIVVSLGFFGAMNGVITTPTFPEMAGKSI